MTDIPTPLPPKGLLSKTSTDEPDELPVLSPSPDLCTVGVPCPEPGIEMAGEEFMGPAWGADLKTKPGKKQ